MKKWSREFIAKGWYRIHQGSTVFGQVKVQRPGKWLAVSADGVEHVAESLTAGAQWLADQYADVPLEGPSGKYIAPDFNGGKI